MLGAVAPISERAVLVFGISPREALPMDRMVALLEAPTVAEAAEYPMEREPGQ